MASRDADAGGIYTPQGHLALRHSVVTRNRAIASRPYGRFAEGGGVNITSTPFFLRPRRRVSTLTIDASRITANAVRLSEGFPSDIEAHANTGGVLIAGDDDCTKPPQAACAQRFASRWSQATPQLPATLPATRPGSAAASSSTAPRTQHGGRS